MSGFSSIARPGRIPMGTTGGRAITPESLFGSKEEKEEYQRLLNRAATSQGASTPINIKNVKVEIFDLSDKEQVEAYEKLWKELLVKASKMEVIVDSRKDLVNRSDGTSYWLKYVEYVEFGDGSDSSGSDSGKNKSEG